MIFDADDAYRTLQHASHSWHRWVIRLHCRLYFLSALQPSHLTYSFPSFQTPVVRCWWAPVYFVIFRLGFSRRLTVSSSLFLMYGYASSIASSFRNFRRLFCIRIDVPFGLDDWVRKLYVHSQLQQILEVNHRPPLSCWSCWVLHIWSPTSTPAFVSLYSRIIWGLNFVCEEEIEASWCWVDSIKTNEYGLQRVDNFTKNKYVFQNVPIWKCSTYRPRKSNILWLLPSRMAGLWSAKSANYSCCVILLTPT